MTPTTIRVCDRWPLALRPGTGGHYAYLDSTSRKNPDCFLRMVSDLPTKLRVREYFGGVGIFSTIVQNVVTPVYHVATDLDLDCAAQLESMEGVIGGLHDAMTPDERPYDLVVLDFPVATIHSHKRWPWEGYLKGRPRYVIFSDTAFRRVALHRATYSVLFGEPIVTHEDYVNAYSRFLWRTYGYSVTRELHHVYTYLRAEPVPPIHITVEKV